MITLKFVVDVFLGKEVMGAQEILCSLLIKAI